jgi:hypothetical protein
MFLVSIVLGLVRQINTFPRVGAILAFLRNGTNVPTSHCIAIKLEAQARSGLMQICGMVPKELGELQTGKDVSLPGTKKGGQETTFSIIRFLPDGMRLRDSVFEPHEIAAMSAFRKVCEALNLQDDSSAKRTMAARIINLARRGECSPNRLCDSVIQEASLADAPATDVTAV